MVKKCTAAILLCTASIVFFSLGLLTYYLCSEKNEGSIRNFEGEHNVLSLDEEYSGEMLHANSNVEKCEINSKYASEWKKIIDQYFDRLTAEASEGARAVILSEQIAWEEYAAESINLYQNYLEQIYQGGSIVPVLLSEYEYELYRAKALELCDAPDPD